MHFFSIVKKLMSGVAPLSEILRSIIGRGDNGKGYLPVH